MFEPLVVDQCGFPGVNCSVVCCPLDRMATPATGTDEGAFKTPKAVRVKSFGSNGGTPITIPSSPFMKKLGCGTGVNVYLMDRFVSVL